MNGRMLRRRCAGFLLALAMLIPMPEAYAAPVQPEQHVQAEQAGSIARRAGAEVDWTDAGRGHIRARWTGGGEQDVKLLIDGPGEYARQYVLPLDGSWVSAGLTEGDGSYAVTVAQRREGKMFRVKLRDAMDVKLDDPLAPFLGPDAFADCTDAVAEKAEAVCGGLAQEDAAGKIRTVAGWVAGNVRYDMEKAEAIKAGGSGYGTASDPDVTLETGKGVCYDFAALAAAMLRSQGVPCKLAYGWANGIYHAWIYAWDGDAWILLDPTFEASGRGDIVERYVREERYEIKHVY